MICDPYICVEGPRVGEIAWFEKGRVCGPDSGWWQEYAYFERVKLKELRADCIMPWTLSPYSVLKYTSGERIGYSFKEYDKDTESSRLLKRAEFLKAVCEKEGVEWHCCKHHVWLQLLG